MPDQPTGLSRSEQNKTIIRRLYDEVHSGGNLNIIDEIYAHDVEVHIPGLPEDPYGPAMIKELIRKIHEAFPGVMVTVEDLIAEHDKVVASVMWRGPVLGRGQGASPRNPLVAWPRLDIYRIVNDRIVEQWADRDDLAALHQLGIT
jgi:predicted ester cyclase